jgi:diguanylate cyclase (GGDEF)-like protein
VIPVNIGEIMNANVLTISQDQPVSAAAQLMRQHNVGGLVVLNSNGSLAGIVTSRDLRGAPANQPLRETMSRKLIVVQPETSLWEAIEVMNAAGVERLPVVAGGKLTGIVTKTVLLTVIARHTDSLTGLYTAAYLRDVAERLLRTVPEISIVFIDIDDFGLTNKRFGHAKGDWCLCVIANLLRKHAIANEDFPSRFGGDEFAVASSRPLTAAFDWAKTFLNAVKNVPQPVPISISIGIAGGRRCNLRPETNRAEVIESLINLASLACTKAKIEQTGVEIASGKSPLIN